jgi:hypothetical protein
MGPTIDINSFSQVCNLKFSKNWSLFIYCTHHVPYPFTCRYVVVSAALDSTFYSMYFLSIIIANYYSLRNAHIYEYCVVFMRVVQRVWYFYSVYYSLFSFSCDSG